ncbi:Fur family transcriptional regulator [Ilumatobacter sp.]|uniref:Fur family transcriptional regulator n=1 Tax=Ilumatobacter sp. TaxID=1967498 RepID=UPI003C354974
MAAMSEFDRVVTDLLAPHDLRYTAGRRALVSALRAADRPVTLPELLEMSVDLPQSSAYRNLSLLEDAGVVRRLVHGADHAHYELAETLTEHHHHLICNECGLVQDVTLEPRLERTLDSSFAELAADVDFVPTGHIIDIYGLCADCR